jgi:hypothetical protein
MFRIIILVVFFGFSKYSVSQKVLTTRIEDQYLTQWTDNRLKVVVEGHMCNEIVVTASSGQIKMNSADCEILFTAADTSIHRTTIKIGIKQKGGVKWLQEMDLPVLMMPDPTPVVGGYASDSSIPRITFLAQRGISVPVNHSWHQVQIDSKQQVTRYSVKISRKDSVLFSQINIDGSLFPEEMLEYVRAFVIPGDEISFYDITTLIYGKELRKLSCAYRLILK